MYEEFIEIVGSDDASFDSNEIKQYSHDIASIPLLFKDIVQKKPAEAILRPESADEISRILKLAYSREIPITVRGAGSSALGSIIPLRGGIVIDLTKMNQIIEISSKKKLARVQPGIVWEKFDKVLAKKELSVLAYPTSAPSSTVGGWISTGGFGVGSYKYGHIKDHIDYIEVVYPQGEIKKLKSVKDDNQIESLIGTEGLFGIITEIALRLRSLPKSIATLYFNFSDDASAVKFLEELPKTDMEPFFVKLENKNYNTLLSKIENGETSVDASVIVRFENDEITDQVFKARELAVSCKGREADAKTALHHWENRFYPMRLKKEGPSMLAAELILPLKNLSLCLAKVQSIFESNNIKMMTELHLIGKEEILLMVTYLTDERDKEKYLNDLLLVDAIMRTGFKLKGKPYGTGIWNSFYVKKRFPKEKLSSLKKLKKEIDPKNILNPGKFFSFQTRYGISIPPFLQSIGMLGNGKLAKLGLKFLPKEASPSQLIEKIKELEEHPELWSCAQCGFCVSVCPVYEEIGWESVAGRGKIFLMKELLSGKEKEIPPEYISRAYQCTTCGACREVCQTDIDTVELWENCRKMFGKMGIGPLPQHETLIKSIKSYDNPLQQPRTSRDRWVRNAQREAGVKKIKDISIEKAPILYHVGCIASFDANVKEVAYNTSYILQQAGVDFGILGKKELCCASTLKRVGDPEFENVARKTLDLYNSLGVETVVTSCSGCFKTFKKDYPLLAKINFKPMHIVEFLEKLIEEGKLKFTKEVNLKVTYHDPCHLGRHAGVYETPRKILKAIPGVELIEMEKNRENAKCCGAGGGFRIAYPDIQNKISVKRVKDDEETGASELVSTCPFCYSGLLTAITSSGSKLKMRDITEIIRMAL
ncbi:MAG: hypothetical protein A3C43_00720 [Candidatus Schekmanbacteria bacterium RIFCSPHIGHO2_02_FULL_38_11]|nr:MAG: hypothetical protein A3C43_00720 [Candidatus Schekmanbacteria bacterium RIFCSPHIGHO2_02_FULL_38_11]